MKNLFINSFLLFLSVLFMLVVNSNLECSPKVVCNSIVQKVVSISLKVSHQSPSGDISLKRLNFQNGDYTEAGKFKFIGNQTFIYQGDIREPNFYIIDFFGKHEIEIILVPGQIVTMEIDLLAINNFVVKGSEETELMYKINSKRRQLKDELINPVIKELIKAQKENKQDKIIQITKNYRQNNEILKNELKQQMKNASMPVIIYSALKYFDMDEDMAFLDSLSNDLKSNTSKQNLVKYFIEKVNKAKLLAIGAYAKDIALPNPEGDVISLSSLKGKYVLIDFWASWSKQCREVNVEYRKIYNNYKSKGFEIYSISLDDDRRKWLEAINEDLIHWLVLSDLKGFNSDTARLYNIEKLPQNYLIDKDGRIIAKNLRGSNLEKILAELLK